MAQRFSITLTMETPATADGSTTEGQVWDSSGLITRNRSDHYKIHEVVRDNILEIKKHLLTHNF